MQNVNHYYSVVPSTALWMRRTLRAPWSHSSVCVYRCSSRCLGIGHVQSRGSTPCYFVPGYLGFIWFLVFRCAAGRIEDAKKNDFFFTFVSRASAKIHMA